MPLNPTVQRRHVLYISGFDPKGPAHYHRLYAEQAALAGSVAGYRIEVGRRRTFGEHSAGWSVRYRSGTDPQCGTRGSDRSSDNSPLGDVATEFEFLRWDDIVRRHWPRNPARLAWDLVLTTFLYLRTGALWTMFKLAWPPVVALLVPFLILLTLVLSGPLAVATGWAVARSTGVAGWGVATGMALIGAAIAAAWSAERRLNMQWLLRSYAFTGRQGTRGCHALETRLDAFAQRIVDCAQAAGPRSPAALPQAVGEPGGPGPAAPCDELLIVAHSSGSILATAALARALVLDPGLAQRGPRLALLTLGQWSPLLSSLPSARTFRQEVDRLAREPGLDWIDFTAPPDGCCFALTDPVGAAGLIPARADHPRLLSPRFAALFSPAAYAEIKRDRLRLHFQYLMAGELPGDYDYTAITAGPLSLGARFRSHPSVTDFKQFRLFG